MEQTQREEAEDCGPELGEPGLRKPVAQEIVKRLHVLQPPVLASPNFAHMFAQFHKPDVTLVLVPCLPGQDRVDPAQHQAPPGRDSASAAWAAT